MNLQPKKVFQANELIHDRFLILGKLDNKKHSSIILKGFDKVEKNFVVIKITSAAYREKSKIVTKILQKLDAGQGVPKIIWRGMEGPNTFTVTECLGPNLKKLFLLMDKQFTIPTICMIAIQVLNTVEYIHSHDYVCCNIMPKEILISLHKKNLTLFITDYKQARKVKSNRGGPTEQVSHTANKSILNKFSSVNLHLGLAASKKDDLESLAYILVYFFKKGNIFDRGTKTLTKEEKIKYYEQQKLSIIPETFCHGLPSEMTAFLTYIKSIQTNQTEKIDYDLLKKLFKNLMNKQSSVDNFQYDWMDKARTYNLDPNSSKSPSELTIITHSPRSEASSDLESRHKESLSPELNSKQERNEFDFLDVDEFPNNAKRPSICDGQTFEQKVKTISHIKRNSILSGKTNDTISKNRSNSEIRDHKSSTSEELSWTVKNEEFTRPKTKSVTETIKVSKFGKTYANNKESKSS